MGQTNRGRNFASGEIQNSKKLIRTNTGIFTMLGSSSRKISHKWFDSLRENNGTNNRNNVPSWIREGGEGGV